MLSINRFFFGRSMVVSWDSIVTMSPSQAALAAERPFNSSAVSGTVCTTSMFTPECYQLLIATIFGQGGHCRSNWFGFGPIPKSYRYQTKVRSQSHWISHVIGLDDQRWWTFRDQVIRQNQADGFGWVTGHGRFWFYVMIVCLTFWDLREIYSEESHG